MKTYIRKSSEKLSKHYCKTMNREIFSKEEMENINADNSKKMRKNSRINKFLPPETRFLLVAIIFNITFKEISEKLRKITKMPTMREK